MQRYRAISRAVMLASSVCALACEDHPATPLEPEPEARFITEDGGVWTTIEGIEFYEYEGGQYPWEKTPASISGPRTTGDVWSYAASVNAFFDFRGHGATQSTTWELTRLNGARVDGGTVQDYGSHTGLALSGKTKQYRGSIAIKHPFVCDLKLTANSDHSAWWIGVVITASKPFIALGKWGTFPAVSVMEDRKYPCGSIDDGDGDGEDESCGGDYCDESDEPGCTECQQWLYYSLSGTYLYDEWDCNERSASYCEMLVS